MSWANLDLCGGWPANDELALLYLKEGTKPAATINFEIQSKSLSKGKAHLDDLLHRYGINVEEKTFGYALLSKDDKPYEGLYNWIFGIYPDEKKRVFVKVLQTCFHCVAQHLAVELAVRTYIVAVVELAHAAKRAVHVVVVLTPVQPIDSTDVGKRKR